MNLYAYLLALVVVACTSALPGMAQFSAGCTGYAQSLSLSGDVPDGQSIRAQIGYGVGASAALRLFDDVDLTVEPSLDLRHGRSVATISVTSMAIPIGVRIWSQAHTWMFTSGVAARVGASGTRTDSVGASSSFTDGLEQLEVGVYLGVGYRFAVGGVDVLPEFRYEQGISNLLREATVIGLPPTSILRTNGVSFRVACQYRLGGAQ